MDNMLPLNAVSAVIIISGEIGSPENVWKGPDIPVVLRRPTLPSLESGILDDDYAKRPENFHRVDVLEPHPNPPFELPPAGNLSLHIQLGKMISEGRTGMVFDCECSIPCGNETLEYQIPPIVVKLATQYHSEDMTKEAIMYEGLQCLQGSVIPRCYGFFQFRSTDLFDFGPMSILLLEKLGGHLTLGKPLPNGAESELETLCIDLASLHIIHNDLRYANILCVLSQEQGGLPSLPSPISGRSYRWRLIDLDRAYRTAEDLGGVKTYYYSYLPRVLKNVPFGCIVEPWE
ncbi:MAG: hypothetical protein NXY57DRAFT_566979 [Lentinula lateritia]|nr:MAG: hypothetical protein NXY57DRAFT_566979 [Lentinula lateritia]